MNSRTISLETALLASFSALYAVILKLLPGIPAYGFPGVKIQIAITLAPIYGFILGGVIGPISILLGTLLAMFVIPSRYTIFDFFTIACAPLGALTTALTLDKRALWGLPRWAYSIIIYLLLFSAWISTDAGRYAILFTAPYAAAALAVLLKGVILDRIQAGRRILLTAPALLIGSASGILADHFLGSLEAIIVFRYLLGAIDSKALSAMYLAAMPIVLVERGLMILASFIMMVNLHLVIGRSSYVKVRLE